LQLDRLTRDQSQKGVFANYGQHPGSQQEQQKKQKHPGSLQQQQQQQQQLEMVQAFLRGDLPGGFSVLAAYHRCLIWLQDYFLGQGQQVGAVVRCQNVT